MLIRKLIFKLISISKYLPMLSNNRAVIKGHNLCDFPLMLWVKLPVVDRIHKLAVGTENKAIGDSEHNNNPRIPPKFEVPSRQRKNSSS